MRSPIRILPGYIFATIIAVAVVVLLFTYTFNVYFVTEAAVGIVRVNAWAPYFTGALLIGVSFLLIKKASAQRVILTIIGCVGLVLFLLSLRTLKFYATDGQIYENIPMHVLSHAALSGPNEQNYCYKSSLTSLELKPSNAGPTLKYFRGLWPSSFPDSSVKKAFMGAVPPCSN